MLWFLPIVAAVDTDRKDPKVLWPHVSGFVIFVIDVFARHVYALCFQKRAAFVAGVAALDLFWLCMVVTILLCVVSLSFAHFFFLTLFFLWPSHTPHTTLTHDQHVAVHL